MEDGVISVRGTPAKRVPATQVRKAGRATQGVRVMRLEKGRSVAAVAPVVTQAVE